jgi:hypothetical protein
VKINLYVVVKNRYINFYSINAFPSEETLGKILGSVLVILPLIPLYHLSQTGKFTSANHRIKLKNKKGKEFEGIIISVSRNI